MPQTTLARPVSFTGIGLHSGKDVQIKIQPASTNTGITFFVYDSKGTAQIKPSPDAVSATALATTLSTGKNCVSTVEHILAALSGLEIDNAQIHVLGGEIPIMDGSALPIVQLIRQAGTRTQMAPRHMARIKRAVSVAGDGKAIHARPHKNFLINYTIDFPHKAIGKQFFSLEITPDSFTQIAYARTFGFMQEVEYLHSKGLALGGSLANAVVLDDEGVINVEGLRSPDEFVRHKMLDFIGDMAMLGLPLKGAFDVHCSGHHHNNVFLRHLQDSADLYLDIATDFAPEVFVRPSRLAVAAGMG